MKLTLAMIMFVSALVACGSKRPAPAADEAAAICPIPTHTCPVCGVGGGFYCAAHCEECPVLATPVEDDTVVAAATCGGDVCGEGTYCCGAVCGPNPHCQPVGTACPDLCR